MEERFKDQLRQHGYSQTRQRLAVFRQLISGPVSAKELARSEVADTASVYRAIHVFKRSGIAHDVVIGGRSMVELSEDFDKHHHHAACVRCGTSVSFEEPRLEAALGVLARRYGLSDASHSIEISGVCRHCAADIGDSSR